MTRKIQNLYLNKIQITSGGWTCLDDLKTQYKKPKKSILVSNLWIFNSRLFGNNNYLDFRFRNKYEICYTFDDGFLLNNDNGVFFVNNISSKYYVLLLGLDYLVFERVYQLVIS